MIDKLTIALIATGAVSASVVAVPLYWHTPPAIRPTGVDVATMWPAEALKPPSQQASPEVVVEEPLPAHPVVTLKYRQHPEKLPDELPSAIQASSEPQPQPQRNVCERTGGWRVETRHSWHCEYPDDAPRRRHHHHRHRRRR